MRMHILFTILMATFLTFSFTGCSGSGGGGGSSDTVVDGGGDDGGGDDGGGDDGGGDDGGDTGTRTVDYTFKYMELAGTKVTAYYFLFNIPTMEDHNYTLRVTGPDGQSWEHVSLNTVNIGDNPNINMGNVFQMTTTTNYVTIIPESGNRVSYGREEDFFVEYLPENASNTFSGYVDFNEFIGDNDQTLETLRPSSDDSIDTKATVSANG